MAELGTALRILGTVPFIKPLYPSSCIINLNVYCIFIYFILRYEEGAFYGLTSDSSYFDCLYFSMTTQSSVGYGDIGPVNSKAKFAVMLQQGCMIFDLFTGLKDIGIAS